MGRAGKADFRCDVPEDGGIIGDADGGAMCWRALRSPWQAARGIRGCGAGRGSGPMRHPGTVRRPAGALAQIRPWRPGLAAAHRAGAAALAALVLDRSPVAVSGCVSTATTGWWRGRTVRRYLGPVPATNRAGPGCRRRGPQRRPRDLMPWRRRAARPGRLGRLALPGDDTQPPPRRRRVSSG